MFVNGPVVTVDEAFSLARSVAVRDGRIVVLSTRVGSRQVLGGGS